MILGVKHAIGFLLFVALLAGTVWLGLSSSDGRESWVLREIGNRAIGSMSMQTDGRLCWQIDMSSPPAAMHLMHDPPGPGDPVALTLFEPPNAKLKGCGRLDPFFFEILQSDERRFYVDGHIRDDEVEPYMWAELAAD